MAVAGNQTDPLCVFNPFIFGNKTRPKRAQEQIKVFLKNIYWADIQAGNPEFRSIEADRRIRAIMAMAFSHSSPKRLAYISRETINELPPNLGQCKSAEFAEHVSRLAQEGYRQYKNTPFRHALYIVDLPDGSPQFVTTLETEMLPNKGGSLYTDLNMFSLCWQEGDQCLYFKDGNGISTVALDGTQQRIYSLAKDRMFFSELKSGKKGSVLFIERNNLDVRNPPPAGGADELITIDSQGKIISRQTLAECYQWYFHLEGVPQSVIGNGKWAYAYQEFSGKNTPADTYLVYVGRLKPPLEVQPYRVDIKRSKMPFYCIPIGFNTDETCLLLAKKFNPYRVKSLKDYQPDAPYSELIQLEID